MLESILSTVNVRIFRTKVISAAFSTVHVTRKDAETTFVRKTRTQNVDEIDTWSQFHQHFMRAFFIGKPIEQLFSNYVRLCNFLVQNYWQKSFCPDILAPKNYKAKLQSFVKRFYMKKAYILFIT